MIAFISDIHLGCGTAAESRQRERRVVDWLNNVACQCEEIYLVGDIFDFWYEYKRVVPKGFTRFFAALANLNDRGVKIHFFEGNHDMWMRDYIATECGATVNRKGATIERYGRMIRIEHGDDIYARRIGGLTAVMNHCFRSNVFRWSFSHLVHPDCAIRFGQWWSAKSLEKHGYQGVFRGEGDFMVQAARTMAAEDNSIDFFVFGHNHCAVDYDLGNGRRALFLGEWQISPVCAILDNEGEMKLNKVEL